MISFLGFSIKRAVQGLWRNAVMSLAATITLVLMLLLLSGLVIMLSGLQAGIQFIEQKVEVIGYLNEGVAPERVADLQRQLESLPDVASVVYLSKEEALAEWQASQAAQGREDLTKVTGFNPIPASLNVKLRDPRGAAAAVALLNEPPGVIGDVQETEKVVDGIIAITGVLRTVGLVVLAMVGLTVLFIVVNTIRMAVMARADEIEIMRLVGASDAFIRWPFIFEGLLVGLLGAAITLALLGLAAEPISQATARIVEQVPVGFDARLAQQVVAMVLASGLALGGIGAYISVRTYLIR